MPHGLRTAFQLCAITIALAACSGGGSAAYAPAEPSGPASATPSSSKPPLTANFDTDADGNGVADRLDKYVAGIPGSYRTKAAATAYFRLVSKLAAKVIGGVTLTRQERVGMVVALECYTLSADEEGVRVAGLEDEFMRDRNSFNAMYALMGAMNGTLARTTTNKAEMCAAEANRTSALHDIELCKFELRKPTLFSQMAFATPRQCTSACQ